MNPTQINLCSTGRPLGTSTIKCTPIQINSEHWRPASSLDGLAATDGPLANLGDDRPPRPLADPSTPPSLALARSLPLFRRLICVHAFWSFSLSREMICVCINKLAASSLPLARLFGPKQLGVGSAPINLQRSSSAFNRCKWELKRVQFQAAGRQNNFAKTKLN